MMTNNALCSRHFLVLLHVCVTSSGNTSRKMCSVRTACLTPGQQEWPALLQPLSLTIFSSKDTSVPAPAPVHLHRIWLELPMLGCPSLTTVADTWALKPREFSCTHYWANFTRKRVIPSGFFKSSYHYPTATRPWSLFSLMRKKADPWITPFPALTQFLGQTFQTPKHNLLGAKDVGKANTEAPPWSNEGSSCSRWPGRLATDFKWHTLAQPWPWHSVCNKGKPEMLAELNSSPSFFWA